MEDLIKRRGNLKRKLTRAKNKVDANNESPLDVYDVGILEEQLTQVGLELDELSDEVAVACPEGAMGPHEEVFNEMADRLYETKHKLRRIAAGIGFPNQVRSNMEGGTSGDRNGGAAATAMVKLPKLHLPKFSGDLLQWMEFRDLYRSSVHDQPLSGAVKMRHLKGALSGEAAGLIQHYQVSDANYNDAWNVLEKRYQNTKELVRAHVRKFNAQPFLKEKSATGLRSLVDTSNACILALKALGRVASTDESNDWVIFGILERLDNETRELWEAKLGRNVMPKLPTLLEFLDDRVSCIISSTAAKENDTAVKPSGVKKQVSAHQTSTESKCLHCDADNHMVYNCPEFLKLSVSQRRDVVKAKNLCYNCLRTGHPFYQCRLGRRCKKCKKMHNTLLHIDVTEDASKKSSDVATVHMSTNDATQNRALFATAFVSVVDASGIIKQFRALLDPGADVSFVTENAVQMLGLKKTKTDIAITGLGANSVGTSKGIVKMTLTSSLEKDFIIEVDAYVVQKVTGNLPKAPLKADETALFDGIPLADPYFAQPGSIDLLLGADVVFDILRDGRIAKVPGMPIGQMTAWGYVVGGKCPSQAMAHTITVHHVSLDDHLDTTLRKFWELEEVPRKRFLTDEDKACEKHFLDTHRRDNRGRYIVRLPFRENVPPLGASLHVAVKRLKMMEQQLSKTPELKSQYIAFMDEYLKLGHMEEIPENEIEKPDSQMYYLPHHPIIKADSSTTKVRVVFDASAKTSSKISLNDRLMTGPKLQDDLFPILVRFLLHLLALKADIAKMYRQILLDRRDIDFQRIVWRESPDKPIKHYWLLTVTYGLSVAPYLAKRCLEQLTKDEAWRFLQACLVASTDFYMDDLMSGASNKVEAIQLQQDLFELLKVGGFELRKWTSNSVDILEAIRPELRETQVPFKIDQTDTVKTLGIAWNPLTDEFSFKVNLPVLKIATKRSISSNNAKVFDPLGWISPVTFTGKILLQDLWRCDAKWDEPIPDAVFSKWSSYQKTLQDLESIRIPRCVYDESFGKFDLLGFCDASQKGYAAVVYIRSLKNDGSRQVHLLTAKSKVAPVKQKSLPRLELCGAVLLARLIEAVIESIRNQPESVHAWTDSTVVLEWMKSNPDRWHTFVANRVAEVQEVLPVQYWHHVAGVENPADCASRGITPAELAVHSLWWHGPEWLGRFSEHAEGEYETDVEAVVLEEKKAVAAFHTLTNFDFSLLHQVSSLPKIIRITAMIMRFLQNCRNKVDRRAGPITVKEMVDAMQAWVRLVQKAEFAEEFECLAKQCPLPNKSRIASLNPFMDSNRLIRVGGRLRNAKLSSFRKFPFLLPKKHRFIELLITHEHLANLHAGPQLLLATLQRKYWILGARDIVRFWIRRCVICSRHRAESVDQLMGDLPAARVVPQRAFLRTGVDYAGPITLRVMKGRGQRHFKGYVAIFICLATRAMHLEVVSGLTTQAFMAAFRRFAGRRSRPTDLYSDCGRTFVGAQKELRILQQQSYNGNLACSLAEESVQFHFNPPGAPHFGGLWEAGIKSVKYHLRRVMGNLVFDFEEMQTLLIGIEACLNSRPISALSSDPDDLQPLTPGHFLVGEALTAIPDSSYVDAKVSTLTRWQLVQRTSQDFWRRWSQEYLTRLQQRPKWWSKKTNVDVNDLVLIKDERYPPLKWKLGRIRKLHPGKDGCVRVVTLKTTDGDITRPVTKLALLPIDN